MKKRIEITSELVDDDRMKNCTNITCEQIDNERIRIWGSFRPKGDVPTEHEIEQLNELISVLRPEGYFPYENTYAVDAKGSQLDFDIKLIQMGQCTT